MNLMQLRYFQAVCDAGTVTRAADALHISQPSISGAIKELEDEFGVVLFNRHYRGMTLTPEGQKLLALSRTLIDDSDRVCRIMKDMGVKKKTLRVGVPPMLGSILLPGVFREFLAIHPEIHLEILESGRTEVLQKINSLELDLAILPNKDSLPACYQTAPMALFELGACLSPAHPLACRDSMSIDALAQEAFVFFKEDFYHKQMILARFKEQGVQPRVLLETSQLSTILSFVANNTAVAFLYRELVEDNSWVKFIPLDPPLSIQISLVWNSGAYLFQNMKDFITYLEGWDGEG